MLVGVWGTETVEADAGEGKGEGGTRRTAAIVEAVECTQDGRWVAVATRKRTVRVVVVNPYGGKPDQKSPLEGRVRNFDEVVSRSDPKFPCCAIIPLAVYADGTKPSHPAACAHYHAHH